MTIYLVRHGKNLPVEADPDKGLSEAGMKEVEHVAIDQYEDTMFVGHLPFMERLAAYLITGSTEIPVVRFENGQIACLEKDLQTGSWIIRWTIAP